MKEKIFPVSSYVAINDEEGDVVVKALPPPHTSQLPRRESEVRSVRKVRREEGEADSPPDKHDQPIKKTEEEEENGGEGMAVLPVAGPLFRFQRGIKFPL